MAPIHLISMMVEGQRRTIYWDGDLPPSLIGGASLRVTGYHLGETFALSEPPTLTREAGNECSMSGPLKSLVLLLVPPGTTMAPDLVSKTREQFFSDAPDSSSLNRFWKMNSFGTVSATGEVRVVSLRAAYGENETERMYTDMIEWAETNGIDLASISRLYIAYPSYFTQGIIRAAGLGTLGCRVAELRRGVGTMGVVWLAAGSRTAQGHIYQEIGTGLIYHESGHNFGFHHHRLRSYPDAVIQPDTVKPNLSEYSGIFSPMGSGESAPFAAAHRAMLGWLREGVTLRTVTATGEFELVPPNSSGPGLRSLRIPRRHPAAGDLWVEYLPQDRPRDAVFYANPNGAVINFSVSELATQRGRTFVDLLNMNPFSSAVKVADNFIYPPAATLVAGKSFFDPESNLTVHVLTATSTSLRVRVVMGSECGGTLPATKLSLPFLPTNASMTLQAPRTGCLVTASSPTSWIKVAASSPTNRISYSIEANPAATARDGVIYIDGRAVQVNQAASPVSRTPLLTSWEVGGAKTSGYEGLFAFNFVSPDQSQLRSFRIELRKPSVSTPSCILFFNFQATTAQINMDGSGELKSSPVTTLQGMISNQLCRARLTRREGVNKIFVAMEFDNSMAGDLNLQFTMTSMTGESITYPLGSYRVEANAPTVISNTSARQLLGNKGLVQFEISDTNGLNDVFMTQVSVQESGNINPPLAETCRFFVDHKSGMLGLFAGDRLSPTTPSSANFGSNVILQARACKLDASRAKLTVTQQVLSVEVPVEFPLELPLRKAVFVATARTNIFGQTFTNANYPVAQWLSTAPALQVAHSSSVRLSSLSGNSTSVSLTASKASGMGSITLMEARFGNSEGGNCWFRYEPASQRISLLNDTGTSWLGPLSLGGSGILENAQCSIQPQAILVSGSLTSLEATIPVRFNAGFAGARPLLSQVSSGGTSSGWLTSGSFDVNAVSPAFETSLLPVRGSGHRVDYTFSLQMPPTAGEEIVEFLIANLASREKACSITMNLTLGRYSLSNNDGNSDSAPGSFGASRRSNSQCALNQVQFRRNFGRINMFLTLFFEPGFAGEKNVYVRIPSSSNPTYRLVGRWNVTPDAFPHITLDTRFESSPNTIFKLQATDIDGLEDVQLMFFSAASSQVSCSIGWSPTSPNSVLFAGATIALPSTRILRGTNCEIDLSAFSAMAAENTLTLETSIRFPAVTEAVTLFSSYIRAADSFNSRLSPAQHLGTWLPFPSPSPNASPVVLSVRQPKRAGAQLWLDLHSEDQDGVGDLQSLEAIIGSSTDSPEGCRFKYDAATNSLSIYSVSTEAWSAPSPLIIGPRISNSDCELEPSKFTLSTGPHSLRLLGPIRSTFATANPLNIWIRAHDRSASSEWTSNGVFQPLPGDRPFPASISIAASGKNSAIFLSEWGSLQDFSSGSTVGFRLIDTQQPGNPVCQLEWRPTAGQLRLLSEDGTTWGEFVSANDESLTNSKCSIKSESLSMVGQRLQAVFSIELLVETKSRLELQLSAITNNVDSAEPLWVVLGDWSFEQSDAVIQ